MLLKNFSSGFIRYAGQAARLLIRMAGGLTVMVWSFLKTHSKILLEAFAGTTFIFVIALSVHTYLHKINVNFLNPDERSIEDIEFSDFYFSQFQDSVGPDNSIIIINFSDTSRAALAACIEELAAAQPLVIALDYQFNRDKSPEDDSLMGVLDKYRRLLVLANGYYPKTGSPDGDAIVNDTLRNEMLNDPRYKNDTFNYGYTNVDERNRWSTVRYFRPVKQIGDTQYSFATAIVKLADTARYDELRRRCGGDRTLINYKKAKKRFRYFESFPGKDSVKGKIVLLGFFDKSRTMLTDAHFTPYNKISGRAIPDMYGVEIQAHIVSMILRSDYIDEVPYPDIFRFIACFLFCIPLTYSFRHHEQNYHLIFEAMLICFSLIIVSLSMWLLYFYKRKLEPSDFIVLIIPAGYLLYLYKFTRNGGRQIVNWIYGSRKTFISKTKS